MKALFYSNGMDVFGPVSIEEFSKNKYYKSTLIWYEGLTGWVPISDFQELKHLIGTLSAPALDQVMELSTPGLTPPLSKTGTLPVNPVKRSMRGLWLIILFIGCILPAYYLYKLSIPDSETIAVPSVNTASAVKEAEIIRQVSTETEMKTYRMNWAKFITVAPNDYKSNMLVGIEDLKITVKNNSPYILDSMKVKVSYLKANGDVYQTEVLEFGNVGANTSKPLYAPNSNRGVKVSCSIMSLHSHAMKLCFVKKDKDKVTGEDPYLCP